MEPDPGFKMKIPDGRVPGPLKRFKDSMAGISAAAKGHFYATNCDEMMDMRA